MGKHIWERFPKKNVFFLAASLMIFRNTPKDGKAKDSFNIKTKISATTYIPSWGGNERNDCQKMLTAFSRRWWQNVIAEPRFC